MQKKILLVTGASSGIGAATACLAAQRDYGVAVNYRRNRRGAEDVVAQIRAAGGVASALEADVSDWAQVRRLFESVDASLGPISALVNNAAVRGNMASITDVTPQDLTAVFSATLFGAFYCTRAAVERMALSRGGQGGVIVNVGSEAARFGGNRLSPYAAAKAGLHALTVGLARELGPEGIRVNAVSPGVITTDRLRTQPDEQRHALQASIPLGRTGSPEEVAEAILWLLSHAASYVTGAVITIAGGR